VIVANISSLLSESHLRELFEFCGTIRSLQFTSETPRVCTIDFTEPAQATAAMVLSGTPFGDKEILVYMASDTLPPTPVSIPQQPNLFLNPMMLEVPTEVTTDPPMPAEQDHKEVVMRTIYVGGLGNGISEDMLERFFAPCGPIHFVRLGGDIKTSQRFGFVEFLTKEAADNAVALSGRMLGDRQIKVGKANNPIIKPKSAVAKQRNLDEILNKVKESVSELEDKVTDKKTSSRT